MKFFTSQKARLVWYAGGVLTVLALPFLTDAWNFQGSCNGVPAAAFVGQDVVWTTSQTSSMQTGTGHYEWTWSGTDSLSGSTGSVTKNYSTAGTKTANVLIKMVLNSGYTESINRSCQIEVIDAPKLVLSDVSCASGGMVRVHFVLNQLPTGVSGYGNVSYVINGQSRTANFLSVSNGVAHYEDFFPRVISGDYNISTGSVIINDFTVNLSNPKSLAVACEIEPPVCPILSAPDRILVNFLADTRIYSTTTSGRIKESLPVATSIPAGSYVVTLASFDGYSNRVNITQAHEQWFTKVFNNSTAIGQSGVIADLTDFVESALLTQIVNPTASPLVLAQNATNIIASHAFVGVLAGSPNSVMPICVAFDPIPPTPPEFEISCSASPTSLQVGETAIFTSSATGGMGPYTYSWTGTSGLSGSTSSVEKFYFTTGVKTATVTVTSGSVVKSAICEVEVVDNPPPPPSFTASCSASQSVIQIGGSVMWSATASGGTGTYTYDWIGTDGLSGTTTVVSKSYSSVGVKEAAVTIISGSESKSVSCLTEVSDNPPPPPPPPSFNAVCSVSQSVIQIGDSVTWSATASGGTSTYTYDWTGTEGLSGTSNTIDKIYSQAGTKNATVAVSSGSNVATASCSVTVLPPPGCVSGCGGGGFNPPEVVLLQKPPVGEVLSYVYLSQIPYTGVGDYYKLFIFLAVVLAWSGIVAYAVYGRGFRRMASGQYVHPGYSKSSTDIDDVFEIKGEDFSSEFIDNIGSNRLSRDSSSLPSDSGDVNEYNGNGNKLIKAGMIDLVAGEAQKHKAIISEEGIKIIIAETEGNASSAMSLLEEIIKIAEPLFEREDGWLLLNKDKVSKTMNKIKEDEFIAPLIDTALGQPSRESEIKVNNNSARGTPNEPSTVSSFGFQAIDNAAKISFVNWLAIGDKKNVFDFLTTMRSRGGNSDKFLKSVILGLDSVYRARHDDFEGPEEKELTTAVSGLSDKDLENLIEILFSVVDNRYKHVSTGLKVAMLRASELGHM